MEHVVDLNEYISESSMKMLTDAGFDTSSSTHSLTIEDPSPIHQLTSGSYVCDLIYRTHKVPTYTIAELLDRIPQEYCTNVGYDDSKYTISVYHEGECLTIVQSKTLSDAVALVVFNLFTMSAMDWRGIFEYSNRYLNIPPILKYSEDISGFLDHPLILFHGSFWIW